MQVYDPEISAMNGYKGGVYQQATSIVTQTSACRPSDLQREFTEARAGHACYELEAGCFAVYGFEYVPGFDDAVCPQSPPLLYASN